MSMGTFVVAGVAAVVIIALALLFLRERRKARLLLAGEERRLTQIADLEREARDEESRADHARSDLRSEQDVRRQLTHDRDTARAWVRRLRQELAEAQRDAGTLGDAGDPYELVLRTAVELLGAEKGLLLAYSDDDGDGDLDVRCAFGFEDDPSHSDLVQHVARQTIPEEKTLRIDDPARIVGSAPSGVDREIENLVAIPVYIFDKFHGVVVAANKPGGFHDFDDEVLLALGDQAGASLHNARLHGRLRNAYIATVRVLADAIEAKDPFLRGHSDQVSDLVAGVARSLELGAKDREDLVFASLLHDIGKIGISEQILLKPSPLTPEERAIVELHPRIGYRLVEQIPELRSIALPILHHHERFDGAGYPAGLRRDQIPLAARVIAIADAFSAMISERPYGTKMSASEACDELKRCAGSQFDPELVGLFCAEVERRGEELDEPSPVAIALSDPELEQHRRDGEGVLGLTALGLTDGVTLIYSHSHLQREARALAQAAAVNGRPFSVMCVELAELERINHEEGFARGDAVLRGVAVEAERLAARCGGLAARLSGRRIAVLVPGADEQETRSLGEDLQPATSIVVRVATWQEGETGDEVVRRAREASTPAAVAQQ